MSENSSVAAREGVDKDAGITYEAIVIDTDQGDGVYKSLTQPTIGSQQASPTTTQLKSFKLTEIAVPPFDMDVWSSMPEYSTRLSQCIRLYARNTVGLGWKVVPTVSITKDDPAELRERYDIEREVLLDLLLRPNENGTFSDLMLMAMTDKLTIGNGYFEIVRNQKGEIVEMYPAKSRTIRALKNGTGYVQLKGNKLVYFKKFGDTKVMDSTTGEYRRVGIRKRATELIHMKEYTANDDFYGIPRYRSTAPAIMGNRAASERNLSFFQNDAVPRMALTISGGKLSQPSVDRIQEFFKAAKGVKNAHRMMIIQIDTEATQFTSQAKPDVQLKPLTVGDTDDASFQKYRSDNDEEVREAFGIAKAFFTPEDVNKAVAYATKEITNEQEFDPTQKQIEHMFYHTIITDMFSTEIVVPKSAFPVVVSKAKKFLKNNDIKKIQDMHFGEIFFQKSSVSEEEMCKNSAYVVDIVQRTKLYKYKKMRKDVDGTEILIFESLPLVTLQFDRPKVLDEADKAEVNEIYLEFGVLTPNEVREELGREHYPEDLDFGDTPLPYFERNGEYPSNGKTPVEPADTADDEDVDPEEQEEGDE